MIRFTLIEVRFERGRSGRPLNVFCFLGMNGPFEIILADENLPLTDEKLAQYVREFEGITPATDPPEEAYDPGESPIMAVLKHYGSPLTRDEYLAVSYLGQVGPDEEIPAAVEETFPKQFQRRALHGRMATEKVQ